MAYGEERRRHKYDDSRPTNKHNTSTNVTANEKIKTKYTEIEEKGNYTTSTDMKASLSMSFDAMRSMDLKEESGLSGDWGNILLLLLLYTLQGIPMGLAQAVPLILSMKEVSYTEQAIYSLVAWPYSVKLLWAPIVDSLYSEKFGRRKSWLIPTQFAVSAVMIVLSFFVDELLGDNVNGELQVPNVRALTVWFFILYALVATQDIAVDGWALTLLKKRNIGYAANCNAIGQTVGYLLAYMIFMALNSPEFCNSWLRSTPSDIGILSLSSFMRFWGVVFLVTTIFILIWKHEQSSSSSSGNYVEERSNDIVSTLREAYIQMWNIFLKPSVLSLTLCLLTCKFGFAATDAVTQLKLVEHGMPKEHLGIMAVMLAPVGVLCPAIISQYTSGPRPLDLWLKAYPFRLFISIIFTAIVYFMIDTTPTPFHHVGNEPVPIPYALYGLQLIMTVFHQFSLNAMFVSQMSFFARISDPLVGGTYMTLLNTLTNLGSMWPRTMVLYLVDWLTVKSCDADAVDENEYHHCHTVVDGFYIMSCVCTVVGIMWLMFFRKRFLRLQMLSQEHWHLN